jgi:hypothetical protein
MERLAGELSGKLEIMLRQHLDNCPDCQREYGRSLKLQQGLKSLAVSDPGADFWQSLARKTYAELSNYRRRSPLRQLIDLIFSPRLAYIAGLAGCLVLVIYFSGRYLLPQNYISHKTVVKPEVTDTGDDSYREMLGDLTPFDELAYNYWALDTAELEEVSQRLGEQLESADLVANEFLYSDDYYPIQDLQQLIEQLDTDQLEAAYQSIKSI